MNNNNNNNINKSNINHYSIKKAFLKHSSPEENNKKNNITNDSSSIPNIIKDKLYKSSRAYINSYNSKGKIYPSINLRLLVTINKH